MKLKALEDCMNFFYKGINCTYFFTKNSKTGAWQYTWLDENLNNHYSPECQELVNAIKLLLFLEMYNLKTLKEKVGNWGVVYDVSEAEMLDKILKNSVIQEKE